VTGHESERVALVTGASGGIGAAIARRLDREGYDLAISYNSNEPEDVPGLALQADLSDPAAPGRLVDAVERELGPIDVLVANAGIGERRDAIEDVTREDWDTHIAVNLTAPFLLAQRVVPGMRERGFGRLLFMSSVAAFTGGIVGPHYAASKSGLHGMTHWLASRLAGSGVTANAIAPALIEDTGMLPGGSEELAKRVPVGRLGKPDEVADLALAVIRNGYITNQVIGIDGGMHPAG
jgi:3-oxoacyl-[acyl-carrier protein] reductase